MRRYSDPIEVRRSSGGSAGRAAAESAGGAAAGSAGGSAGEAAGGSAGRAAAGSAGGTAQDLADRPSLDGALSSGEEPVGGDSPDAFIWHGRLYVVRRVLAHWRERRSWWRDALDPVPGQPTGIDAASREQHVWRVEASRGQAYGVGVFDLTNDGAEGADATWRLVGVAD